MKTVFILSFLALFSVSSFAQTIDTRRKIDVTGVSEAEITPDILYVSISLKEYYNGNKKVADINDLEKQLQQAVIKAGLPKENLFVNNLSGYNEYWEKKKNPSFAVSKQYRLKLTDPSAFNKILSALDPKSIAHTGIESYDHSRMTELRKELKIKALLAAKEKAVYLAEALGNKVGEVLDIQELNIDPIPGVTPYANAVFKTMDAAESAPADIDFKKIKLNYQIKAVFELSK